MGASVVLIVIFIVMYFGPTIIALIRKHRQAGAIAALNLLLGWTVGWIGSFIWSLMSPQQPQTIIVHSMAAPAPGAPRTTPGGPA